MNIPDIDVSFARIEGRGKRVSTELAASDGGRRRRRTESARPGAPPPALRAAPRALADKQRALWARSLELLYLLRRYTPLATSETHLHSIAHFIRNVIQPDKETTQ